MKRQGQSIIPAILAVALAVSWIGTVGGAEAVRPTLAVYIIENQPLARDRPPVAETIVKAELIRCGYKLVPSVFAPGSLQTLPRDVGGVWNADRRMSFRQQSRADVLWMATVEYKLSTASRPELIVGTVSVVARAIDIASGESLWFGRVADRSLQGLSLADAGRMTLADVVPAMIADFDRAPRVKAWPSFSQLPQPGPPEDPSVLRDPSRKPYTGVIIDAEHLRVQPSFRSSVYTQKGVPIYGSEGARMSWSENMLKARQQAGPNPLILRAQSSDRGRIILRESDAGKLQRESAILGRKPVTVVVQPPKR